MENHIYPRKKKYSYRKPLLSNYQVNSTNRVQNLCWKIEGSDSYFVPGSTLMINLTKYIVSISLMCISIVQHQLRSKYSMSLHSYQKNNTLPGVWLPSNSNKSFPITSQPIGKGTNVISDYFIYYCLSTSMKDFDWGAGGRDRGVTLFFRNGSTGFMALSIAHIKQSTTTPEIFTLKHTLGNFCNACGLFPVAFLGFSETLQDTGKKGTY